MIPDAEAIIGAVLRTHSDIVGLGARVSVETPATFTAPWVRMVALDGRDQSGGAEHLIDNLIDFHCYAGKGSGSVEAKQLVLVVRSILHGMRNTTPDDVVVTDVRFVSGPRNMPDTDHEPARARYILSAEIDMHPVGGA